MTPPPLHPHVLLFNIYSLMSPAIVGLVLVFAVAARGVARLTRKTKGRE